MGEWMIVPSDSDLLHHGVKDQHWGIRNGPPYPLQIGRAAYKKIQKAAVAGGKAVATVAKGTGKAAVATGKAVSKTAKVLKKHHDETKVKKAEKKEKKEQKKTEKMKKKAVSKNSYEALYDMKDRLSYKELEDAKNRIKLEQEIYYLGHPKQATLSDKISGVMKKVGMVNDWYKTGKTAWNNFCDFAGLDGKIGFDNKKQNNQNNNQNNNQKQNNNNQKNSGGSNTYTFNEGSQVVFLNGNYNGKGGKGQDKPNKETKTKPQNETQGLPNDKKRNRNGKGKKNSK